MSHKKHSIDYLHSSYKILKFHPSKANPLFWTNLALCDSQTQLIGLATTFSLISGVGEEDVINKRSLAYIIPK